MRQIGKLTFVAVALLSATVGQAQARPDFSGRWVLANSHPEGTAAFGPDFAVLQTAQTIQVSLMTVGSRGSAPTVEGRTPEYPARVTFTLDGGEHPTKALFEQALPQVRSETSVITMTTEESTSKATWVGSALVLMSYNKLRTAPPARGPNSVSTRQTVRRVLSIDPSGLLEVETWILADPTPWARSVSAPSQVKSTYRRQQ
jgi:hypothetical protein